MKVFILMVIDFFYPPFRRILPVETFRYAACGGFNMMLDILLFFISYNFIFQKEVVDLGATVISPHIAAFISSFIITFPIGFFLNRYVVFTDSNLRGRIQLFRYFLLVLACIGLNFFFLKLFVEEIGLYPTVAKICTTVIVVGFSYLSQKYFTFKTVVIKN